MPAVHPPFKCVVISPSGKLLDCQTTSVVLPAHDGQIGIWCNHVPMLCKLEMGMIRVIGVPPDVDTPAEETFLWIDGGFALLAANILTITAFDAISSQNVKTEQIRQMIEKTEKLAATATTPQQRHRYLRKVSLLKQLGGHSKAPQVEYTAS